MRRALLVARSLGVCTPPPEVVASDFNDALDALGTGGSLVAHWPMGDRNDRLGGTAITAQGTHETDLPQLALGDVPSRAFDGSAAHGFVAPPTNAPFVTTAGTVGLLIQPDLISSKMSLVNLSDPARTAGSFSLEIAGGGAPRVFRRKTGSPRTTWLTSLDRLACLWLAVPTSSRPPGERMDCASTSWTPTARLGS